ncbi:MAG: T9SS C-terminal target domain-containing protein [Cytophagales bacterium]|nr:MAG: T9SS C-terminal target domain-containing protein [Cytophagales bacterium]TAF61237.1 MAG: T9SS C-terminal target domain-containing protein [Cytophagales bacterium]
MNYSSPNNQSFRLAAVLIGALVLMLGSLFYVPYFFESENSSTELRLSKNNSQQSQISVPNTAFENKTHNSDEYQPSQSDKQKIEEVRKKIGKDITILTNSDLANFDEIAYAKAHYPKKAMASSDPYVREKAWTEYLNNHPYTKLSRVEYSIIKELPKYDRPDLAMLHDKVRWTDPSLGYAPTQKRFKAMQDARDDLMTYGALPGVTWQERGSNNVGGRTRAIMWDPNDPLKKKVWAGGVGGGLWYNDDVTSATTSWQKINDFWDNIAVASIAHDPSNTNIFYVGTGEGFGNGDAQRGRGIWKTTNGGTTWAQLGSTTTTVFFYVNDLAVTSTGIVLAATNSGLRRSTDGGTTWTTPTGTSGAFMDLEITASGTIIAARDNGTIHRSTDATGAAFGTAINPGGTGGGRVEVACAPSDANIVYAIAESGGGNIQWFRKSSDGGLTWPTSVTIPLYLEQGSCAPAGTHFTRGQSWYDLILQVGPTNPNLVLAGGIDVHRTIDGGSTWSCVTYWTGACKPYVHADQHAMAFRPGSPNECLFGNDGGIHYSSNVGNTSVTAPSFVERNKDYNVTQFYACAMRNTTGSNYFLAGAQDNGSHKFTTAGVNSTIEVTGGDGAFCHIDQDNFLYQVTSYVNNNYYRSTNGGTSFSSMLGSSGGLFINPTDYDNLGDNLYCSQSTNNLYRINNVSGTPTETDNVSTGTLGSTPTAITVSQHTANRVFVAGSNGNIRRLDNAHTGTTPTSTDMDPSNTLPSAYINCIAIGPSDNHIIVTYSSYGVNRVWLTTNGGTTWVNKTGDLPDMPINWALMSPADPNKVLVATEVGVWSIDDISVAVPDWGPSSTGLANTRCEMLQIRSSDNLVAVATHGRGLFTSDIFANPTPSFAANKRLIYTTKTVTFSDASLAATSWSWNFGAGATPATATGVGPHNVTYSTPGLKTVSLTINGSLTDTKTDYIHVLPDKTPPYLPVDGGNFDVNLLDFGSDQTNGTPFQRGSSAIAGKDGTLSAPNAWVLGLTDANYVNGTDSWLCSPNFNMSAAGTYTLRFRTKYRSESNYDGFIVQYSTNKGDTWTQLGTATGGTWYTRTMATDAGAPGFPSGTVHFGGTSDAPYATTYTERSFNVSFLAGTADVAFRYLFKADNGVTAAGCAIDNFELQAPGGVVANFTASPTSVCVGESVTFTNTSTGSISSYSWNFGAGASPATATGAGPHVVTYSTNGTKTVSLTVNGSIVETKADYISVFPSPSVSIAAGGPITFCSGGSVTLNSTASGVTYQWKRDGVNIGGATAANYTANTSGVYTLEVTNTSNGCKNTSNAITVTVNPLPTPSISPSTTQYLCPPAGSVLLTASPSSGVSYQWRKDAVPIGGATSSTYTATTSGNYQVVTTITATGCSATSAVVAVVNGIPPDPSITPGGVTTFCTGDSVKLFASPATGVSLQWKKDGLLISGATGAELVVTSSGSYTVVATDAINGCSKESPAEVVTVKSTPAKPTSPDVSICPGETATLAATAVPGMIAWYDAPTGGALLGIGSPFTTPPLSSTTSYWVQVTAAGCPSAREEVVVTISSPAAPTVSTPPTICAGNTATLTASSALGSPTYQWYSAATGGTLLFTGNPYTTTSLASTTSFWVSVNGGSCESSRTEVVVNVVSGTSASISPSSGTICAGGSVLLTASPSTGVTYQWKKDGVNIAGSTSGTYLATTSGNYTVVISTVGPPSCSAESGIVTITVNPVPAAPTASSTTICAGNTATLTASSGAASPSFAWYDAPTGGTLLSSSASYTTPVLFAAATYYVEVSSAGCTSATRTAVTVNIGTISAPTASGTSICFNTNTTLTAASGATSPVYNWYNAASGGTLLFTGASFTTPTLTTTTSYWVSVTSGSCTSSRTEVVVNVNPLPVAGASALGTTIFCAGSSVTLTATPALGVTYQWYKDAVLIGGATGATYNATTSGSYSVVVTSTSTLCSSTPSAVVNITVNPNPAPTIIATGATTICDGNSATLTSSITSGVMFQWKKDGVVIPLATASSVNVTAAGSYTVVVTNTATGCSGESPAVVIVVNPVPSATIAAGEPTTFCEGGNVGLSTTPVAGMSYQWLSGASSIAGATSSSYTAASSGLHSLIVTNNVTLCSDTSNVINVTVNPKPVAVITASGSLTLCTGGSVILNASPTSGMSFVWKKDGVTIGGATASSYTASLAGVYTVEITNIASGCTGVSAGATLVINPIPSNATASGITICDGNTATLSASSTTSGAGFEWYNAASGGTLLGVGSTFTSPVLMTSTTYYVQSTLAGCASASRTAVLVTVDDCPDLCTVSISSPDSVICYGSTQTLTAVVIPAEVGTSYQWKRNGLDIAGATSSTYETSMPGTYTVVVNNSVCLGVTSAPRGLTSGTVVWVDKVNTDYEASTQELIKTSSSASFNAGAASHNVLAPFTDGWLSTTIDELPGEEFFVLGLSNGNTNETETSIGYGFYFAGGNLKVMEMGGVVLDYGAVNLGDMLRIERVGANIVYKVNGTTVHTSATDPSLSAVIDASILAGDIPRVCASFRAKPLIAPVVISNSSCSGPPSGKIVANVEFGYPNYNYVWSTGASTLSTSSTADSIDALTPGEYTLTFTDAYGDVIVQTYTVGSDIIWEILEGAVSDAQGKLTKVASTRGWTSGAISRNTLNSFEDGWVEFTVEPIATGHGYAIGLNSFDLGIGSLLTAEYGLVNVSGSLAIREAGITIPVGPVTSGERLRVSREGGTINYYRNGVLFHSTLTDPSQTVSVNALILKGSTPVLRTSFCYPLRIRGKVTPTDCGLATSGSIDLDISGGTAPYTANWSTGSSDLTGISGLDAGFYNVFVEDAAGGFVFKDFEIGNAVVWEDLVGVTPIEYGLQRTLPLYGLWNSGAASRNRLLPDDNGWVEFHIDEVNGSTFYTIGLSNLNIGEDDLWINYGINYAGGQIKICENGVYSSSLGFALPGDVLRVERSGSNILYSKNGNVFMMSSTDPSLELRVDVSIYKGRTPKVVQTSFCAGLGLASAPNTVEQSELSETLFELFPNPSTGIFKLRLQDEALAKTASISIVDLLGRELFLKQSEVKANAMQEVINLEHLSKGTYFLKIISNGKNFIKKIVLE